MIRGRAGMFDATDRARAYGRPTARQRTVAALGWEPTVGGLVWAGARLAQQAGRIRWVWLPGVVQKVAPGARAALVRVAAPGRRPYTLNLHFTQLCPRAAKAPAPRRSSGG